MNVAREATAQLAARGWCKNSVENPVGNVCIEGSLNYAGIPFTSFATNAAYQAVRDVIKEQFPERLTMGDEICPCDFNDHPDTTLADVLLVLDKAAVRLDEQEGP